MNIVVLGASGRIGRAILQEFNDQSSVLTAVSRFVKQSSPVHSQIRWVSLDPHDVSGHHALFLNADIVIDARNQRYDDWSGYPAMIDATLAALETTKAHYVYIDNIYVYGRPASSSRVAEDIVRHPISVKGKIRLDIENRLRDLMAQGQPIMIVRFPDFYDISTDPLPRFLRWFGPPHLPHQFISTRDGAQALYRLVMDPDAYRKIWHVAGDEPITGLGLQKIAQEILGRKLPLWVFGPRLVKLLGFVNAPARGLQETQYLWQYPVILNTDKFVNRYGSAFIHSHQAVIRELLNRQ
ncbi:Nucleoside-diphosphate-sugar epimerase [Sulfobacillus thermosulfidooxidans DSM 9293]|uniref:Nucleoside-diphosphate-sugar epimerase n=1 Tax=Sulfobacillus thermosulfidooxidans (strain DSM 9293 / VKM B-1269 / AT-1) TaxID=929705 RepID=A0A1W1WC51_SULTA|nr:NAD(P)H-binding protein [Sulfobacillus thermosulfidooxidans]SMC03874.1 Nucleoside-diphosphate-sugar epimerase [Sulfobacillus thermosulfidooxidans DSM 9293]